MENAFLSADDVVRQSMRGKIDDVERAVRNVADFVHNTPGAFIVQVQNSVFLCMEKSNKSVEFHIFSTEGDLKKVAKQIVLLGAELKDAGYKEFYSDSEYPGSVRLAEMTGLPFRKQAIKDETGAPMTRLSVTL